MTSSRWLLLGFSLACVCRAGQAHAEPPLHHNRDTAELADLRLQHPESADLLAQAEALVRDAKLTEADALLAQAAQAAPTNFMVARRRCQVLAERGHRTSAIEACNTALRSGHMAMDRSATASALMTGPNPPKCSDVAQAVSLAVTAKNLTGQPFGDAALCEIAYRVGDAEMLKDCTSELTRIAPNHFLTRRWNLVRGQQHRFGYWLVWLGFAAAALGTLGHALRTRLAGRRALAGSPLAASLLGLCWLLHPARAFAADPSAAAAIAGAAVPSAAPVTASSADKPPQHVKKDGHWQLSRFPINYDDPEAGVPTVAERNKEPLDFGYFLQDLASEGAYAEKKGDYQAAVKYWRALAKAVPDSATGFRRTCMAYEQLKDRFHGLDYCGTTLNLQGALLDDYVHYGNLMLMKPEHLDKAELSDLQNTIKHLREQGGNPPLIVAETLTCELGVHEEDVKTLDQCTQALVKLQPNEPQTLSFLWSLAMFRHDYSAAQEYVDRLKATPYNPELVKRMAAAIQSEKRWWKPFLTDWRYQASVLTVLLATGLGLLSARKKPSTSAPPGSPAPGVG